MKPASARPLFLVVCHSYAVGFGGSPGVQGVLAMGVDLCLLICTGTIEGS